MKIVKIQKFRFNKQLSYSQCLRVFKELSKTELQYLVPLSGEFKNSPFVKYRFGHLSKNKPVSFIEGYEFDDDPDTVVITLAVVKRARGYHLAQRILKALIRQAFEDGIKRLIYRVDKDNIPSIGLAEKMGFSLIKSDKKLFTFEFLNKNHD